MKYNITIFLALLGILFLLNSCQTTKYVPDDKLILIDNEVNINKKYRDQWDLEHVIAPKPNTKFLGIPFKLTLFNLMNPDYQQKWYNRIKKYQDSTLLFPKLFSYKQTVGYANFQKRLSEWALKNSEKPITIDSLMLTKSIENIKLRLIENGYFNASANYKVKKIGAKKGRVTYHVNTGEPYFIDSLKVNIESEILDSIYHANQNKSIIHSNQQFNRKNFEKEANRLTQLFRNSGIYHFSKYAIRFKDIDSTNRNKKTTILLNISNKLVEKNDSIVEQPYKKFHIKHVNIYTNKTTLLHNKTIKDSIKYNGFNFYDTNKIPYKPKYFVKNVFIKPGELYSDRALDLTRMHLRRVNNFRAIRFIYEETSTDSLIANIYLSPREKFGVKTDAELSHSNIKPFSISGIFSLNNINTFRGNESSRFSFQGSYINSSLDDKTLFNAWEIGLDASLKFPRLVLPFHLSSKILQNVSPETKLSVGTSFQKNIGLDKQRFTGIISYNWNAYKTNLHNLEIFNAQLIKNLNISSFFSIYKSEYLKLMAINNSYFPNQDYSKTPLEFIDKALNDQNFKDFAPNSYKTLQNIDKRYKIIIEDVFVPSISYSYTYNTQNNFKDLGYFYIKGRISSAGLLFSSISTKQSELGEKQFFGINIAQYIKFDFEFIKHWKIDKHNVMALRSSFGIGIPYANSTSLPFSRSYFAGGPNDIRAWKIYDLGPGAENSGLEFNVGNLKFLTSLEERFDIYKGFKGAIFIDTGNIWDTSNSELTNSTAKFQNLNSLQSIAIGSGLGLRYDFNFLVLRLDLGVKIRRPHTDIKKGWTEFNDLKKPILNIGINYPF